MLVGTGVDALAQAQRRPVITAIQAGPANIAVTVDVPEGIKQVTLESRTRLGAGTWVPCAVRRITGPGVLSFELAHAERLEMLRVRGDTNDVLPASFFSSKTNFTGQLSADDPANSGALQDSFMNGTGPTTSPGSGDSSRAVVESDIWVVRGDTLYFFNQYRGLQVIDLHAPDAPVIRGTLDLPAVGEQMYLVDDQHAVLLANVNCGGGIGNASQALVVDVSGAPRVVASVPIEGYIQESRLVGTALYVASQAYRVAPASGGGSSDTWEWGSAIVSFDLSNPGAPVKRSALWHPGYGNVIAATDRFLFAVTQDPTNWWQSSVRLVDISAPDGTMQTLGSLQTAGMVADKFSLNLNGDIFTVVSNDRDWVVGGQSHSVLETYSLADPRAPKLLGGLEFAYGENLTATRFDGQRVYVTTAVRVDPLWIVDLTDPTHPRISGFVEVPGFSSYLEPLGDRLVTVGVSGPGSWQVVVSLFDVHDAAKPALLSQVPLGENCSWSEATYDEKAFTVLPDAGLILVPFGGWVSNGYAAAIQLIDLGTNSLAARGVIDHTMEARRATLHGNRVVSLSGRELLTVDATDRDHPVVTSDTELSWPVNRVLIAGDFLIEVADAVAWQGAPNPAVRVVKASAPDTVLGRLELTNGLPVIGAAVREGRLYLLQGATTSWLWCLPATDGTDPSPVPPTNNVFLAVFDLAALPDLKLIGQAQAAAESLGWNCAFEPLWLSSGLLVWSGGGGWWSSGAVLDGGGGVTAVKPGAVSGPIIGDIWWPWWGGSSGRLFACDVSEPTAPKFTALVDLASDQPWWNFSDAFATGNLVYLSHEASEFKLGLLLNGQSRPPPVLVTNADGGLSWQIPSYGAWVTRYYLDVVDFTDPTTPIVRKPVNIPGRLHGISRRGALLYTVAPHWDSQGTSDGTPYLDASAYDGVSASLVATLKLTSGGNPEVLVLGEDLLVPQNDTTANTNRLESWTLSDSGAFAKLGSITLAAAPNNLVAFGNLLAAQFGATVDLFDATDPATLRFAGSGAPEGCVWGDLELADGSLTGGLWLPLGSYGVFGIHAVK